MSLAGNNSRSFDHSLVIEPSVTEYVPADDVTIPAELETKVIAGFFVHTGTVEYRNCDGSTETTFDMGGAYFWPINCIGILGGGTATEVLLVWKKAR